METAISVCISYVERFNRTALKIGIPFIIDVLTLPSTAAWTGLGPLRRHVNSDEFPNAAETAGVIWRTRRVEQDRHLWFVRIL